MINKVIFIYLDKMSRQCHSTNINWTIWLWNI